jgi:hypothetical protein
MTRLTTLALLIAMASPALAQFKENERGELQPPENTSTLGDEDVRVKVVYRGKLLRPVRLMESALRSFETCPDELYYALPRSVHKALAQVDYSRSIVLVVAGQPGERIAIEQLVTTGVGLARGKPTLHVLVTRPPRREEPKTSTSVELIELDRDTTLGFGGGWEDFGVNFTKDKTERVSVSGRMWIENNDVYFQTDSFLPRYRLIGFSPEALKVMPGGDKYHLRMSGEGVSHVKVTGNATRIRGNSRMVALKVELPPHPPIKREHPDFTPVEWTLNRITVHGVLGYRDDTMPFRHPEDNSSEGMITTGGGEKVMLFLDHSQPAVGEYGRAFKAGHERSVAATFTGWTATDAGGTRLNRFHMLRATVDSEPARGQAFGITDRLSRPLGEGN